MKKTVQIDTQARSAAIPAKHIVVFSDSLDIAAIQPLYRQLEAALAAPQSELILDAAQVSRVDAAGLQTLVMFYREARTQGYPVRWKNPSSVLSREAEWTGLADWLEFKIAA